VEFEHIKNHKIIENHLYECLYDILKANIPETEKRPALQKYKAEIVQLHARRRPKILLDTSSKDRLDGEDPSLYQIRKLYKRREAREIKQIQETDGTTHRAFQDIAATFMKHLTQNIGPLEVDPQVVSTVWQQIRPLDPRKYAEHLKKPITVDEVIRALRAGARRKTPGIDGICLEFYIEHWETIHTDLTQLLNEMFLNKHITANQKQGILLCLPKSHKSPTPEPTDPSPC